jgi:hypothetical protein
MTQNTKVLVAGVAALVAVVGAVYALGGAGDAPRENAESPTQESTLPPLELPRHAMLSPQGLVSPEKTLETQVRALTAKQEAVFRGTLTAEAKAALTGESFERCVVRVRTGPVSPEWAEPETTDGGVHIRRATVAGGAKVTFREINGRWFADSVWCKEMLSPTPRPAVAPPAPAATPAP